MFGRFFSKASKERVAENVFLVGASMLPAPIFGWVGWHLHDRLEKHVENKNRLKAKEEELSRQGYKKVPVSSPPSSGAPFAPIRGGRGIFAAVLSASQTTYTWRNEKGEEPPTECPAPRKK